MLNAKASEGLELLEAALGAAHTSRLKVYKLCEGVSLRDIVLCVEIHTPFLEFRSNDIYFTVIIN